MIEISKTALSVLSESLEASGVERDKALRLKQEGDHLVLELAEPEKRDRVIFLDEKRVLIVDPVLEERFGDAFIDVENTAEGLDLIMRSSS